MITSLKRGPAGSRRAYAILSAVSNRFHAVGVGEEATSSGPSAVLTAASNAVGDRLDSYPVTPEKVVKALGRIGKV